MRRPHLIVTRHPGAVAWILEEHPDWSDVPILPSVTSHQVRDRIVCGVLPMALAAECSRVYAIEFISAERRGEEKTADDMRALGARLVEYSVARVSDVSLGDLDAMETSRLDGWRNRS